MSPGMANCGTSEMEATLALLNRALAYCVVVYFWKVVDSIFVKVTWGLHAIHDER
jgi:hypothetical protein